MSDENLMKLTDEINALKDKLNKVEGQNAELIEQIEVLKEQNTELTDRNTEMKEQIEELTDKKTKLTNQNTKLTDQNSKLMTEIEAMKAEKLQQQNDQEQTIPSSPNSSQQMEIEEENSTDLENEIDGERPKLTHRSVPNPNCLFDILKWPKRTEMADSALSTASRTFNRLCWPKLHGREVKPHRVQRITTLYEQDSETFQLRAKLGLSDVHTFDGILPKNYTIIPIANIDSPLYITGFRQIHLLFLDGQILEFLKIILPSIKTIHLHFRYDCDLERRKLDDIRIGPIHHLLTILAPKISKIHFMDIDNFLDFRYLGDFIEEIQHIIVLDDAVEALYELMKWLNTERTDGEPKLLSTYLGEERNKFIDRIKQEFLESKRKAAFIIDLGQTNMEDLTLENEATGEILSFYQGGEHQYIVRHPKGMEHFRTNWEEKFAMDEDTTEIGLEIEEIGLFSTNGDWSPRGKEDDDDDGEEDDEDNDDGEGDDEDNNDEDD